MNLLASLVEEIPSVVPLRTAGVVKAARGPVLFATLPHTAIGDLCLVRRRDGSEICAEVVAFHDDEVCLAPFDSLEGISPGAQVISTGAPFRADLSAIAPGQIVNCFGQPFVADGKRRLPQRALPKPNDPPSPLERPLIETQLYTGIAAIDGLCSLGKGQRVGLFAAAGVGKSTLLGMLARGAKVDVTVVGLIGERGREVREFLEESLGERGRERSVAVVSTSDESPIRRVLATETATAIAEHFRSQGKHVLLLVDSLTRTARALREVGLAAGELPIRQGYTASVYAKLPKLLERAGTSKSGSITAIYTTLTTGEGESDPLGEEIRSLLDGHVMLDSKLAESGVRPAIDITTSISRLMPRLHEPHYLKCADRVRGIAARLKRDKDLLMLGGTPDRELAAAIKVEGKLRELLSQKSNEFVPWAITSRKMEEVVQKYDEATSPI